jgi:hypothetical protein
VNGQPFLILWTVVYSLSETAKGKSQYVGRKKFGKHYTGFSIMFSVITNIYNKKIKGPTLMELSPATGKLKIFV